MNKAQEMRLLASKTDVAYANLLRVIRDAAHKGLLELEVTETPEMHSWLKLDGFILTHRSGGVTMVSWGFDPQVHHPRAPFEPRRYR